jgi:hypothetical protein
MHPDRFRYSAENCSIHRTLDIVGEKWTLLAPTSREPRDDGAFVFLALLGRARLRDVWYRSWYQSLASEMNPAAQISGRRSVRSQDMDDQRAYLVAGKSLSWWDSRVREGGGQGITPPPRLNRTPGYTKGWVRGISGFTPAPCLDWVANASVRRVWVSKNRRESHPAPESHATEGGGRGSRVDTALTRRPAPRGWRAGPWLEEHNLRAS